MDVASRQRRIEELLELRLGGPLLPDEVQEYRRLTDEERADLVAHVNTELSVAS
jgi:hypothetical protein